MKTAWIAALLVVAGLAPAQTSRPATRKGSAVTLVRGPVALEQKLDLAIDPSAEPRMLVVRGQRKEGADATFEVNGEVWGSVVGFAAGAELFEASMPLAGAPGAKKLAFVIRPAAPGVVLDQIEVVAASRVPFVIHDQSSKAAIPGVAMIETVDGKVAAPLGPAGGFPRERSWWISQDGHGDLYVPFGSTATFLGRASPFRGIDRQRHVIDARDNLLLNFLLPADQLPEGSTILEAPPRAGIAPDVQRAVDRARGIGKRPKGFKVIPAKELLAAGGTAIEEALANPDIPFLATNETGSLLFPPPSIVTAELPGGELLHSTGPVILLVDRRRESGAVRAYVKVRLPEGVVADRLYIWAGKTRTEHVISGPSTIPLDVIVPPRTPIALIVSGPAPKADAPFERAAAFRIFRAP